MKIEQRDQSEWTRKAVALAWFTIAYNIIEGVVSIGFGLEEESMALAGFGVDSLIEVASAFFVLQRLKNDASGNCTDLERERKGTFGIGCLFILLALVTFLGAGLKLAQVRPPETTVPGLVVSLVSLSFMFYLWRAKLTVATHLNSATLRKDADCARACMQLSVVLFTGSILFLFAPSFWWIDSVAAIVIGAVILQEGISTVKVARSEDFAGGCCG